MRNLVFILAKLRAWPKYSISLYLITITVLSASTPAHAMDLAFKPDLKAADWDVHTPSGKTPAHFVVEPDGALTVTASNAVAFLYRFVPDDHKAATSLSWEWQVPQDFPGTDLTSPGVDDRPIAIHVYFTDQKAGLMKRFGRGLAGMFGVPVSGRAITYVWGGLQPVGTIMPNPFMKDGEGVLIVRQASKTAHAESWRREVVDLAADYRAAFNEELAPVSVIAVSADTDDTGAESVAVVRGLKLGQFPSSAPTEVR